MPGASANPAISVFAENGKLIKLQLSAKQNSSAVRQIPKTKSPMRPIFIAGRSKNFKKPGKTLFLILFVLVCGAYGLYYWSSRQNSIQSSVKLRGFFYSAKLNDTIKRIEPIYKDGCNTSFWITNYPVHDVVVNLCKYPELRSVGIGDLIKKEGNSTECTITGKEGKVIKINLQIEY